MAKGDKLQPNYEKLNQPRATAVLGLNNLYVLAELTSKALLEMLRRAEEGQEDELEFEAPSANRETTTVTRDRGQLCTLLIEARKHGLYEQSLVTAVALTEDYLQRMLRLVLRWFPSKLKLNIEGSPINRSVPMDLVLESSSLNEVLDGIIRRQLIATFYGSPDRYFHSIEAILSFNLDKDVKSAFAEIKATRDVLIHNSGMANDIYLQKAGQQARAREGEDLQVDADYFKHAIKTMKKLVQGIFRGCLDKYGKTRLPRESRSIR